MRPALVAPILLLAVAWAGCLAPPAEGEAERWRFSGAFTRGYTQADVRAVCEAGAGRGSTCEMGMSDPPVFGFRFEGRAACETAREKVLRVPNVGDVTPCVRERGPWSG